MSINQITVFLENRAGELSKIIKTLSQNKVDLRAINIAETADYGLLRMITADNTSAEKVLRTENLIFTETPVLAVAVDDKPGALSDVLEIMANENIDINYMYSIFGHTDGLAYMIMQLQEIDKAADLIGNAGIKLAEPKDLGIN